MAYVAVGGTNTEIYGAVSPATCAGGWGVVLRKPAEVSNTQDNCPVRYQVSRRVF